MTRLDNTNWKDFLGSVDTLMKQLSNKQPLGLILHKTQSLMAEYSRPSDDELESIADSYRLMSDYMLRGFNDNTRADIWQTESASLQKTGRCNIASA